MLLTFKDDEDLTIYVKECVYIQLLYVETVKLWICGHVCYWSLNMHFVIYWTYFTYDKHLCGYYVMTDTFMSLFMSYNITT